MFRIVILGLFILLSTITFSRAQGYSFHDCLLDTGYNDKLPTLPPDGSVAR